MNRRQFIACIGAATAWPLAARAQSKRLPKVGIIGSIGAPGSPGVRAFVDGLRDLGLIDGQTITIKNSGNIDVSQNDQLVRTAAELVADKVDVIFASGSQATVAAKSMTSAIPIITISGDPVGLGFAKSLARPGGNITGLSNLAADVSGKRLELLKKVLPRLERVALFFNPRDPGNKLSVAESEAAAASLALKLQTIAITDEDGIAGAFATADDGHAQAIAVITNPVLDIKGQPIVDLALKGKLPLIGFTESFPKRGALLSYGPSIPAIYRRAAYYAQRVLAGDDPAELPIEQPTKFNLVINLKTASALGLTIPDNLLVQADELIE
jgi:putative tryptophan/tyrosine transport system substrate-binding protein